LVSLICSKTLLPSKLYISTLSIETLELILKLPVTGFGNEIEFNSEKTLTPIEQALPTT
jgi:hypothetical protein